MPSIQRPFVLLILVSLAAPIFAQTAAPPPKPAATPEVTKEQAELKKQALAVLRDAINDTNNLRTPENRIVFGSELASLMWEHDEKDARAMYVQVTASFRELISRFDSEANSLGMPANDAPGAEDGEEYSFFLDPTDAQRLTDRFYQAGVIRDSIALSIAVHDPLLALRFFDEAVAAVTSPLLRSEEDESIKYFRARLVAELYRIKNDAGLEYAQQMALSEGITYATNDLLDKIHRRDAQKGAVVARAMVAGMKRAKITDRSWPINSFLEKADTALTESLKKSDAKSPPRLTREELRDAVAFYAEEILKGDDRPYFDLSVIEKYASASASRIRTKFGLNQTSSVITNSAERNTMSGSANAVSNTTVLTSNSASNSKGSNGADELFKPDMSKEELEKFVARTRQSIMAMRARDKKVKALGDLAGQVAKAGDKNLAASIMRDASSLVEAYPKNYKDYRLAFALVGGYANVDPDRAFSILDVLLGRVNDSVAALVKVGELIDLNGSIVVDGELQAGAYGGGLLRQISDDLAVADSTIKALADVDIARTAAAADRLDRPEVRLLGKLMIVKAILGKPIDEKSELDREGAGLLDVLGLRNEH